MGKVRDSAAEDMLTFYMHVRQKYDKKLRPYTKKHLKENLNEIVCLFRSIDNNAGGKSILREWIEHEISQLKNVLDKNENLDRPFRLFVIGTGKAGKSTFINSIVGREIAEVGYLPKTWRIDIFTRDEGQPVEVGFSDGHIEAMQEGEVRHLLEQIDKRAEENIAQINRELKAIRNDKDMTKEEQEKRKENVIKSYERDDDVTHVIWPVQDASFLSEFDLVDTPGMNQILYNHKIKREALAYYEEADGILWLLPADILSDKHTYEDVHSMNQEYPQKSADAIAVLNHFDYVSEEDTEEVCKEANRLYGKYFRKIFPYSAKKSFETIQEGKESEQTERLKHEIYQSFYEKAQENKINDLNLLLQKEQKNIIFFLKRKSIKLKEIHQDCNRIEKDWESQLRGERKRFLDIIIACFEEEIERIDRQARGDEKLLGNMDGKERNQYLQENILKYDKLKNKIRTIQSNTCTCLENRMREFCQNYVYAVKRDYVTDRDQAGFSVRCQFDERKTLAALSSLVAPIDLNISFSTKMSSVVGSILLRNLSNISDAFHLSTYIHDIYKERFEKLKDNLIAEFDRLLLKARYKASMHAEAYLSEVYCNKYAIDGILKVFDEIMSRTNELHLERPTIVQVIKGKI